MLGCGVNRRTHTHMGNVDLDIRTPMYMLGANVIGSRCRAASLPSGLAPHAPRHDRIRGITPSLTVRARASQSDTDEGFLTNSTGLSTDERCPGGEGVVVGPQESGVCA